MTSNIFHVLTLDGVVIIAMHLIPASRLASICMIQIHRGSIFVRDSIVLNNRNLQVLRMTEHDLDL